MTLPTAYHIACSLCQSIIHHEPLYCSTCLSLGFAIDYICSPACLKRANADHDGLHHARPRPPPGISPVWRPSYGRCLVATVDFNPGDIVLQDRPILSGTWRECNLQFKSLTDQQRRRILSFCGSDDDDLIDDAERIARNQIKANEVTSETAALVQILFNNSIDVGNGVFALFEYGSLLAHSCNPNVDGGVENSVWVARALLPIRAGDIIGWNYNLSPNCLMEGTGRRRAQILELRGFICSCHYCQEVDYLRSFRCFQCEHGVIAGVYEGILSCTRCGAVAAGSELEEFENRERTLYLAMRDCMDYDRSLLAAQAWEQLGPYHGVTGRACLEAAACLADEHPAKAGLLERVHVFLSSPSMHDAALVHNYVKERLASPV